MITPRAKTKDDESAGGSELFRALVLELDATISQDAAPRLNPDSLSSLTAVERHELREAEGCLRLLYRYARGVRSAEIAALTTVTMAPASGLAAAEAAHLHTAPAEGPPPPPTRLGRFEIIRQIGAGGHGVVFLARDPTLNRQIALKVPQPDVLLTPSMRRRFLAEGRAAAILTHPNIVPVYEAGEIGPVCYLAQAYVDGPTLAEWRARQPVNLPPAVAADLVAQVADGVEHAHARGILHRDLKPGNVLLDMHGAHVRDGDTSNRRADGGRLPCVPMLSDFGIAKSLEYGGNETAMGTVVGTPAYMSPEQAAGNLPVGRTTDVYSLGAILYELLTGQKVFKGNTYVETLRQVTTDEAVPPRRLRSDIPRDLEAICLKCLEKDPARRYSTAFALAADLRRFLANEPTIARPITPLEHLTRWCRRKPALAGLIGVSMIATVALLSIALWSHTELGDLLVKEAKQRQRAEENEALAHERERIAQNRAYAADMRLVSESWKSSNSATIGGFLKPYIPNNGDTDLRGFEWWFYHQAITEDTPSKVLGRHPGGVQSVAVNSTGDLAASGGSDGVVRLWRLPSGELAAELRGHDPGDISGLAFSPDGKLLASASDDKTVRIWNVSRRAELHPLRGHENWVSAVLFLPDGQTLLSAGADKAIIVWDVKSGFEQRRLLGHTDTVRALAWLASRSILFSASEDRTIRVWDVASGLPASDFADGILPNPSPRWIRAMAIEADQSGLLALPFGDIPILWDLRRDVPTVRRVDIGSNARSVSIQGLAELSIAALGLEDSFVRVSPFRFRDIHFGFRTLRGHASVIDAVALSPDTTRLVSAAQDGEVRLWDLRREAQIVRSRDFPAVIEQSTIAPCGELLAVAAADDSVAVFDFSSLMPVRAWTGIETSKSMLAFAPDSKSLVVAADQQALRILSLVGPPREIPVANMSLPVRVQFSPDGQRVAVATQAEAVVIDVESAVVLRRLAHPESVRDLAFLDQDRLLTSCMDGALRTWSLASGRELRSLPVRADDIRNIAISADGKYVAVRAFRKVEVLELSSGKVAASLPQDGDYGCIAFLGHGRTLMTAESASRPRMWHTATWQNIGEFQAVNAPEAVFSGAAEGMRIVFSDIDHVYVVDARPARSCSASACDLP